MINIEKQISDLRSGKRVFVILNGEDVDLMSLLTAEEMDKLQITSSCGTNLILSLPTSNDAGR
jgi:hypothetical protein